nr:hypothetical protein Iba_chr10bCG2880 [Ipomoea batatas]GMD47976.1 hypothetical protein Iba_chr10fCG1980 [Ipomoea batatas]
MNSSTGHERRLLRMLCRGVEALEGGPAAYDQKYTCNIGDDCDLKSARVAFGSVIPTKDPTWRWTAKIGGRRCMIVAEHGCFRGLSLCAAMIAC